jgi:hypothetical protein
MRSRLRFGFGLLLLALPLLVLSDGTGFSAPIGAVSTALSSFGTGYSSSGSPNTATQYLTPDGMVHLAGSAVCGTNPNCGNGTIATLDAQYRPSRTVVVVGALASNNTLMIYTITSGGVVSPTAVINLNDIVSFEGIVFRKTN